MHLAAYVLLQLLDCPDVLSLPTQAPLARRGVWHCGVGLGDARLAVGGIVCDDVYLLVGN